MTTISQRWLVLLVLAPLAGCGSSDKPATPSRPVVATTFYPTTYFAQRIGAEHVEVRCPVPAGADPDHWMPDAAAIALYQQADLILVNGANYESWVGKVSLPASKVADTTRPLGDRLLRFPGAVTHSHGPGGMHSHEGIDGHTWLDPQNAIVQVGEIEKALLQLVPEARSSITARAATLTADLRNLDSSLAALTKKLGDRPLLASHPAYNYLAKRYGWNLVNVSLDPQHAPTAEMLVELCAALKGNPAQVILWESPPKPAAADVLRKEFNLTAVVFAPCEQPPAAGDYMTVMRRNIEDLWTAIGRW